jgi:hypothetical protein
MALTTAQRWQKVFTYLGGAVAMGLGVKAVTDVIADWNLGTDREVLRARAAAWRAERAAPPPITIAAHPPPPPVQPPPNTRVL